MDFAPLTSVSERVSKGSREAVAFSDATIFGRVACGPLEELPDMQS